MASMLLNTDAVAELSRLSSLTQNDLVRSLLRRCIQEVSSTPAKEGVLAAATGSGAPKEVDRPAAQFNHPQVDQPATPLFRTAVSAKDLLAYETVSTFSWEQTDDTVKVLVPMEGVSKDLVTVNFTATSFDLKVTGLNGRNYRCAVPKLLLKVAPDACSFMVPKSQKRVVIKLAKASSSGYAEKHWSELKEKPTSIKPPQPGAKEDPSAGIMDLMKNMYEDGDEDMKRTIAQAWTESRDKKEPKMPKMEDDDFNFDDDLQLPPM